MAKDFKASQIRTSKIVVSGSESGKPALLIYSASDATDFAGGFQTDMLSSVGSDVYMFVSGNNASVLSGGRSAVTLFGGDVVVSGTFFAEKLVAEVNTTTNSDHYISGALFLAEKSSDPSADSVKAGTDQAALYAKDDGGISKLYFRNAAGITEVGAVQDTGTGSFNVIGNSYVTTSSLSLAGGLGISHIAANTGNDIFFFTSGTQERQNYFNDEASNKKAVFGGDLVVSGVLTLKNELRGNASIGLTKLDNSSLLGGITSDRAATKESLLIYN